METPDMETILIANEMQRGLNPEVNADLVARLLGDER